MRILVCVRILLVVERILLIPVNQAVVERNVDRMVVVDLVGVVVLRKFVLVAVVYVFHIVRHLENAVIVVVDGSVAEVVLQMVGIARTQTLGKTVIIPVTTMLALLR
jgi:hypothetical protein